MKFLPWLLFCGFVLFSFYDFYRYTTHFNYLNPSIDKWYSVLDTMKVQKDENWIYTRGSVHSNQYETYYFKEDKERNGLYDINHSENKWYKTLSFEDDCINSSNLFKWSKWYWEFFANEDYSKSYCVFEWKSFFGLPFFKRNKEVNAEWYLILLEDSLRLAYLDNIK